MDKRRGSRTTSSNPADPRRQLGSGLSGEKSAIGHSAMGIQVGCAKWTTGTESKIKLRKCHKYGTWNIQGLVQKPGKLQVIEKEMKDHGISILGLAETHWKDSGFFKSETGNTIYFSGHQESRNGVAMIVTPQVERAVCGFRAINDKAIHLKLLGTGCIVNVIQVYAPTSMAEEEVLEDFYTSVEEALRSIPSQEITMIMGDFNAKVGSTNTEENLSRIMGNFGLGSRNERGDRLIDFCLEHQLSLTNTMFQHHPRRLYTWISPGDRTRNQIDYILIDQRWKSSVKNVKTYPGADCGSDHQLLVLEMRIRFKNTHKRRERLEMSEKAMDSFKNESETVMTNMQRLDDETPEAAWTKFRDEIAALASQCIRRDQDTARRRKPWMTDETWHTIEQRRRVKMQSGMNNEYRELNREVQRRCRHDKEKFINDIFDEIEEHEDRHETSHLYQKVKLLSRDFKPKNYGIENNQWDTVHDIEQVLEV